MMSGRTTPWRVSLSVTPIYQEKPLLIASRWSKGGACPRQKLPPTAIHCRLWPRNRQVRCNRELWPAASGCHPRPRGRQAWCNHRPSPKSCHLLPSTAVCGCGIVKFVAIDHQFWPLEGVPASLGLGQRTVSGGRDKRRAANEAFSSFLVAGRCETGSASVSCRAVDSAVNRWAGSPG